MEYSLKAQIVETAENILLALDNKPAGLVILRQYNKWYTSSLEFVQGHAMSRLEEFEDYHKRNQKILCEENSDLQIFRVNLTVQLAIIEGSQDHTVRFESFTA